MSMNPTFVPREEPQREYSYLTMSRFFAALWVVVFHVGVLMRASGSPVPRLFDNSIFKLGFLGVSFFFVLSGFILAKMYDLPKIDKRTFYLKRLARIYPSYFLVLLAIVLIPIFQFPRTIQYCAPVFLLFNAWIPDASQNLLGPAWSLTCEAFFYLVFPFIFLWVRSASKATALLLIVLSFVPSVIVESMSRFGPVHGEVYFPLLHLPSFLLGILFAGWRSSPGKVWSSVLALGVAVGLVKVLVPDGLPMKVGVMALPFALLIWSLSGVRNPRASAPIAKLFTLQGNASYVLYLVHLPLLMVLQHFGRLHSAIDAILGVTLAVLLSTLFYLCLDRPIHLAVTRWIKRGMALNLPRARTGSRC